MNDWMKVSRWWHITELDVNNPRGFGVVVLSSSFSQWNFSATLSAAFDHIDHSILLSRLPHTFGISGTVLSMFHTDLSDETRVVSMNGMSSVPAALLFLRGLACALIVFLKLYLIILWITAFLEGTNYTSLHTFLNFLTFFTQLNLVFRRESLDDKQSTAIE